MSEHQNCNEPALTPPGIPDQQAIQLIQKHQGWVRVAQCNAIENGYSTRPGMVVVRIHKHPG